MKKIFILLIIVVMTSIAYFCLESFFQAKKTEKIISDLTIENQSLKEQIKNYNSVSGNREEINNYVIEENKHPIDIEEKKCIEKSHVYDYPICSQNAEKAWDEEIKKNLDLLKKVMSKDEFKHISRMNEKWEKSVYNEIDVINRFISEKDGIINQTTGNRHISDLKKQYALLLISIYFTYTES